VSRTQRVVEALKASYVSLAVKSALRLFVTPFFLSHLGAELMGMRSFIREFLNYINTVNFGIPTAISALVAKNLKQGKDRGENGKVLKMLRAAGQLQQLIAVIAFFIAIVVAIFLNKIVEGLPPENLQMARVYTLISGFVIALTLSSGLYAAVIKGLQYIAQSTYYNIINTLITTILGVVLVYYGWSLYGLALAALIGVLFFFVLVRRLTARAGIRLQLFKPPLEYGSIRDVLGISGWVFVASIGGMLSLQSSRVILGITPGLGMVAVNKYSLLMALPLILKTQANRFAVLMRPGLTQKYFNDESKNGTIRIITVLLKVYSFLAVSVFIVIWLINGLFVKRWVGQQYYAGDTANLFIALVTSMFIFTFSYKMLLHVKFEFKRRGLTLLVNGVVNIIAALVLVRYYGIRGVIIAGLIGEIFVVLPWIVWPVIRESVGDSSVFNYIRNTFLFPLVLLIFWVIVGVNVHYSPETWPGIIIFLSIIAASFGISGWFYLRNDLKRYNLLRKIL